MHEATLEEASILVNETRSVDRAVQSSTYYVGQRVTTFGPVYVPARFVLTGMLLSGFFLVYALRVNLSIALVAMVNQTVFHDNVSSNEDCPFVLPNISYANNSTSDFGEGEFDWNERTQGFILSSFFYGYVLTQVPGGRLAEVFGSKWPLGLGVLCTGLMSLLTPIAAYWSPYAVIAVRILAGLGEGFTYPAFYTMMNMWYPVQEQNTHYSISSNGAIIGTIVTLPVSAWLCRCSLLGGWPLVFYVFGGATCIWFLFWVLLVFSFPEEHPRISVQELTYIQSHRHAQLNNHKPRKIPWKAILTSPAVLSLAFAKFASSWAFYVMLTDLPTYMDSILHFSLQSNGLLNSLIFLAQAVTVICAGICADLLRAKSNLSITFIRKSFHTIACCGSAVCLLIVKYMGCDWRSAYGLLLSSAALMGITVGGAEPVNMDMAPHLAGTVGGFTNGFCNLAGIFGPMLTGFIITDNIYLQFGANMLSAAYSYGWQHMNTNFPKSFACLTEDTGCTVAVARTFLLLFCMANAKSCEETLSAWGRVFAISACMFFGGVVVFCFFGSAEVQPWSTDMEYTQLAEEDIIRDSPSFSGTQVHIDK